jgi:hypothetical protein
MLKIDTIPLPQKMNTMTHRKKCSGFLLRSAAVLGWILILAGNSGMQAQSIANYTVARTTGISYSSIISAGTPCNSWRYTGAFQQDDNRSNPIDIGFDFWYDGVRYTELSVSTNGYIDFSTSTNNGGPTTAPYGYANTQFTSANGTVNAIAPFYDDQTTQGGADPLGNSIRTRLTGTAPNRVLTIEWANMAVYQNTSPNLNYQVKLYESTGQIEFVYGTMTQGTATFSYTCGINGPVLSATPTAAQLKCQQTANTTTFSNVPQNNLTAMPANNSKLSFTPPVPANPSGALTFTNVQASQMTLNWTNWASNEVGYVIYSSSDNINFEFEAQTAANATSATITGLFSATTYYWKVYAVTEGCLSNALNGTQATLPGGEFRSAGSGNWNQNATWQQWNGSAWVTAAAPPTASDNVTITSTHTVTINITAATCHNLTVGQGSACSLVIGNNNVARTLTVNGNLTIAANGTLIVNSGNSATHTLRLYGNVVNNGTLNLQPTLTAVCDAFFLHPYATQTVSGSGAITRFRNITVDKSSGKTKMVDVTAPAFTAATGFLTLTVGTFRLSCTGAVTATPFSGTSTINQESRLWLNSTSVTANLTGSVNLFGELSVSAGTLNVGTAADQNIVSNGGLLAITGGTVNVAGRYDRASTTTLSRFTITGGTMVLCTVGSTSTTSAPFMMDIPGSQFTQSGGTIIIRREGGTGAQNLGFTCTGGNINSVTGGTLQIGDGFTPVGQTMLINTVSPVGNLLVASANATAQLSTNPLTVFNNITLQSGTFLASNLNVNLGGNWSNTGGTYTAGTNTTTFDGTSAQTITRTAGAENFNHLVFSNGGVKTAGSAFNCNNLTINSGATLSAGAAGFTISVRGTWTNNGIFSAGSSGTVVCNGTAAQTIGGTALTTFRHLTIQNAAGVSLTADENIHGTLTLTTGNFTTTGRNFTLLSDSTGTARIGTITGGNITGNIIMQRYIFIGPTQWRQLCSPVTGNTLQGWNDDLITAGFPGSDYPNMNGFYSVATYNETAAGPKEYGYSPPANITDPLTAKKGYFVYVGPLGVQLDVTGPPVKFNQNFTLTYTPSAGPTEDGWNMLGNPYPSAIDWDAAGWTRTNTDNVLYIWNPTLMQYATYVSGVGTNGGSRYIPSSQAFWVRAIGASPSISLTESVKANTDPSFLHTEQQQPANVNNLLSLTVRRNNKTDQAIVRFDPSASAQFDVGYDAMKFGSMDSTMPYIASAMDTANELAINTLGPLSSDIVVPLRVKAGRGVSGNYTISRDSISDLPHSVCVTLEDLYTGAITQLTQGATYTCYISDTTNAPRFLLHFGPALDLGQTAANCSSSADGKAFAHGIGNGPWDYTWKDASGNTIAVHPAVNGTDTLFNLVAGTYIAEVNGNSGYCSSRIDTIIVEGPAPIATGGYLVPPTCSYTADGAIHISGISGGQPPYALTWPDGSHADSLVGLAQGNYDLIITDANNCPDTLQYSVQSNSTLAAQFMASPDTVNIQSTVAFLNYSLDGIYYSWDFGDTLGTSYDPNPYYSYSSPGNYTVMLIASDSICEDTATIVVTVLANLAGITPVSDNGEIALVPASNSVTVMLNFSSDEDTRVTVYDISGRVIAQQQERLSQGSMELALPVAVAVYTVVIERPGKMISRKIVLVKQ